MPTVRRRFSPRWSTSALLSAGIAGVLLGLALGVRFAPTKSGVVKPLTPKQTAKGVGASLHLQTEEKNGHPEEFTDARQSAADADWERCAGPPASPARDEQMAHLLERLSGKNPTRALSLALQQTNLGLRQSLVAAALRGWAGAAPFDAAHWVLQRPIAERGLAAAAVLEGAASQTGVAVQVATGLVRDDPALAHDHGCALIFALAHTGAFDAAASFASAGSAENRSAWLDTAFTLWAEHQPENAVVAAKAITDPVERETAFRAVVTGWAANDPHGLADFALRAPSDSLRDDAMRPALTEWANQDPIAVSAWINRLEPSALLDPGAAAVAIQPPLIARHPDVAVSWAESIFDPELRVNTLAIIIGEWGKSDRVGARRYAETSPTIRADDRASLLASPNLRSDD